jgi:glycosyltransferase involved in cell wall biosynthesis
MTVRPTSVIVCTHDRAALLYRVISQIRAQDYPAEAFEIIVVDHRSTDHTPRIVQQLAAEPGVPVRYVLEVRPGITFARNRGAEEACYPYLAYLDDDCRIEPDWLTQLVKGFNLDEHVEVVGGKILLDWDQQEKPSWFGTEQELWLGSNIHLGNKIRLLEENPRVLEGNMAITRAAWQAAGGFLGMEQFGSQNMAAGEAIYLLNQIVHLGGKIAFIPSAVAYHYVGKRTPRAMLRRAYWQGVSDGILYSLLSHNKSWIAQAKSMILDTLPMFALFVFTAISILRRNKARSMYHLLRAFRRIGLLLAKIHLAGDWARARSWFKNRVNAE